jgi:hypothetical protein
MGGFNQWYVSTALNSTSPGPRSPGTAPGAQPDRLVIEPVTLGNGLPMFKDLPAAL